MLSKVRDYGVHRTVYAVASERIFGAFTYSGALPRMGSSGATLVSIRCEHSDTKTPHSFQQGLFTKPPVLESKDSTSVPPNDRSQGYTHRHLTSRDVYNVLIPEKNSLMMAASAMLVSSGTAVAVPYIFGGIVDVLSGGPSLLPGMEAWSSLKGLTALMAGATVVGAGATMVRVSLVGIVGQQCALRIRKKLFANLIRQDMAFFDKAQTGELTNRLSLDVHEVAEHLVDSCAAVLTCSISAFVAVGCMLYTSPQLSSVALLISPIIALGSVQYSNRVKKLSREHLLALAESTQLATEKLSAIRMVRAFGAEGLEKGRYYKMVEQSCKLGKNLAIMEGMYFSLMNFASNGPLLAVIFWGAGLVDSGSLTVGSLASFCWYAGILSGSVMEATEGISGIMKAQGAGSRLFSLLERESSAVWGNVIPSGPVKGAISFQNVQFSYPTRPESVILGNLNIFINHGEVVAITGPSGCGKLIGRFYGLQSGKIMMDGLDISTLDNAWLREHIIVLEQSPVIFSGSIAENISYGQQDASKERVITAAKVAGIHQFVMRLRDGYDTEVGERGVALSGGQKQRIAMARVAYFKPLILVLDESTSALDLEGEIEVWNSLMTELRRSTIICVTHHPRRLRNVDRILVMSKGSIVADCPFCQF